MPRRMHEVQMQRSQLKLPAVIYMNINTRRRSSPMHHDFRAGQLAQILYPTAMVGVGMCINDQVEGESMVDEDRKIAVHVILERIEQNSVISLFASDQISLATSAVEFAKQHRRTPSRGQMSSPKDYGGVGLALMYKSYSAVRPLLRLWHKPYVWPRRLPAFWVDLPGFIIGD